MSATPQETWKKITASTKHLADETDPKDESVARSVKGLQEQVSLLREQLQGSRSWSKESMQQDVKWLEEEISRLKSAAEIPASNYTRIVSILDGLHRAAVAASRPQNAHLATQLRDVTAKVAGLFQEVDTTEDLNKPLEAIEKAVEGLYGDQSKNDTYYFTRRGKGHHEKKDLSAS